MDDQYPQYPPPVPPPVPPAPPQEAGIGKYALIAGAGCLLLLIFGAAIGIFVYYIFKVTGDPLKVVNMQLNALKENNMEKAYSYCSENFKQITNYQSFQDFVSGNPQLKNSKEFTSNNREIEQGVAKLKGNLVSMEGSASPAEYHLVKEGRSWKVQYIDLGNTGLAQRQGENHPAPVTEEKKSPLDSLFEQSPSSVRLENVTVEKAQEGDLAVITVRFRVVGFELDKSGNQQRMHLVQDLKTYGPDGNLLPELSQDGIKTMEEFGDYGYADLWNSLRIPSSYQRGRYECQITVHDKVSGRDTSSSAEFEL
ncbi:DUF4864 domain-containing protein [bacterium]|nr:DUF4864 domain-containing protein [bacterium]MCI0602707.1 DUF4864 domain-containing protein [bacterium]